MITRSKDFYQLQTARDQATFFNSHVRNCDYTHDKPLGTGLKHFHEKTMALSLFG